MNRLGWLSKLNPFPLVFRTGFSTMHRAPAAMVAKTDSQRLTINSPRDPNTLSNYNNFLTSHVVANFDIDFKKRTLEGSVQLSLKSITEAESDEIILDSR
jgi:leukotriene-A4 hydrolase